MTIRFLKAVTAPQQHMEHCGDGCCSWPVWEEAYFETGEEADPTEFWHEINLDGLVYGEDYAIIAYP
jgi:hypothetical protein